MHIPVFNMAMVGSKQSYYKKSIGLLRAIFSNRLVVVLLLFLIGIVVSNKYWFGHKQTSVAVNSDKNSSKETTTDYVAYLQQQRQQSQNISVLQAQVERLTTEYDNLSAMLENLAHNKKLNESSSRAIEQARILEKELSNEDALIGEKYQKILAQKEILGDMAVKCAGVRRSHRYCQEHELAKANVDILMDELKFMKNKRENIQSRINSYLIASAK